MILDHSQIESAVRAWYADRGRDPDLVSYTIKTADGDTHLVPGESFSQFHEHCFSEIVSKKRRLAWWHEAHTLKLMLGHLGIEIVAHPAVMDEE